MQQFLELFTFEKVSSDVSELQSQYASGFLTVGDDLGYAIMAAEEELGRSDSNTDNGEKWSEIGRTFYLASTSQVPGILKIVKALDANLYAKLTNLPSNEIVQAITIEYIKLVMGDVGDVSFEDEFTNHADAESYDDCNEVKKEEEEVVTMSIDLTSIEEKIDASSRRILEAISAMADRINETQKESLSHQPTLKTSGGNSLYYTEILQKALEVDETDEMTDGEYYKQQVGKFTELFNLLLQTADIELSEHPLDYIVGKITEGVN